MKRYFIILMLLPVLLAANEYSLDQLIDHGLEHSYQIKKQMLNRASSLSSQRSAVWNLLPNADLTMDLNKELEPLSAKKGLSSSAGFVLSKTISLNDPAYFAYRQSSVDLV